MKSWVKKMLKSREDFYKKHPELEEKRLEKIRNKCQSQKERQEMSASMKQASKTHYQKLTWKNPALRRKMSRIKKLQYASNPELRLKISQAMKQVFAEHPNLKIQFRIHFIQFVKKHPDFLKKFSKKGGNPNPLDTKTMQGSFVRSTYEAAVADCLFVNKIKYEYEAKMLFFDQESRFAVPDFYLPEYKTYIEVLGGYPGSQTKARWKRKYYKKYRIKCIFLTPSLILDLKKSLLDKLKD